MIDFDEFQAWLRFFRNALDALFERIERGFGFFKAPGILEQSHQSQPDAGGFEAVAHWAGYVIVK